MTPSRKPAGSSEIDERGVVVAFHEKMKTARNLANGAVYEFPVGMDFLASPEKTVDFTGSPAAFHGQSTRSQHITTRHRDGRSLLAHRSTFQLHRPDAPKN